MAVWIIPIMIAISVVLIVYALIPAGQDDKDRVRRRMSGRRNDQSAALAKTKPKESMTTRMMEKVAPIAMKPVVPKDSGEMSKLRQKLCSAGFRRDNACSLFLASKTIIGVAGLAACAIYALVCNYSLSDAVGLIVCGAGVAFLAPNLWLGSVAKKRQTEVRYGLADSLDLMVVAVEAGLGLDAALQRVGDELRNVHPALSEEFQIAILETQMGIPRGEALENLANRTMVDEVRAMVAMINQAERFGTSISRALRNQAEALRLKRRQDAEQRAQQCAVKLMLPLVFFIFPAIFIVLGGPAVISYLESGI